MLSVAEFKDALPVHLKPQATPELVRTINAISTDPEEARAIRENMVSYTTVLMEGRFKIEDYISAVAYVSHKLMGCSNQLAYKKTFPQRYQLLVQRGTTEKEISSYVSNYNKNKLVNLIMAQSLIPTWVLNADIYQSAINTQFELMTDTEVSPKVRVEAANSILTHLKRPETKKVEIDLSVKDNSGMSELRDMMSALAQQQLQAIEKGVSTQLIAHQPLVPMRLVDLSKDITPAEEE